MINPPTEIQVGESRNCRPGIPTARAILARAIYGTKSDQPLRRASSFLTILTTATMPPSVDTNGVNGDSVSTKVTPFRYTASAAFIDTLIAAGVKYLFVNLGTDHPGLVEVFAYASMTKRKDFPRVMTCPNEMVALTIAHSYAQITGQCQAVLLHVETGTLAMAGALHNAAKARVPVLIWAGASPSTIEGEVPGGRTEFIQFQQEYASHL